MSPSKETVFIHRSHPTRPMLHHLRQQACHLITSVPRCFCWFILPPPSIVAKHIDYGNFSSILPSDLRRNLLNNVCNPSQGHIKSSCVMQIQTPGRNRRPLVHLQWLIVARRFEPTSVWWMLPSCPNKVSLADHHSSLMIGQGWLSFARITIACTAWHSAGSAATRSKPKSLQRPSIFMLHTR